MKVLISGGGIGGLTLAHELATRDVTPVVVEKVSGFRRAGYAMSLFGKAVEVLRGMGLSTELDARTAHVSTLAPTTATGERIRELDLSRVEAFAAGHVMLNRDDLHGILFDAVKDRIDIRFDRTVTGVAQDEDGVDVTLSDGEQLRCDLLVGADGIHSQTRGLVLDGADPRRVADMAIATFYVPNHFGLKPALHDVFAPGGLAYQVGAYSDGEATARFMYTKPHGERLSPGERRAEILDRFGKFWMVREVFEALEDDSHIFYDYVTQVVMPSWSKGRVVWLGDSAWCLSPISGRGAAAAIIGAHLLAERLATGQNVLEHFVRGKRSCVRPLMSFKRSRGASPNAVLRPGSHSLR